MAIPGKIERIYNKIIPEPNSGCWLWIGALTNTVKTDGYATATFNCRRVLVHKLLYERKYGAVPNGMELDHKCRVTCCVNPDHMEAVTHLENVRRGICGTDHFQKKKTHCPKGHPYDGDNLIVATTNSRYKTPGRWCKECRREAGRAFLRRKRAREGRSLPGDIEFLKNDPAWLVERGLV